ncbi:MAG TPA: hypothetical protein VF791_20285 [Pyrinomonadaceae bacterium]
MAQPPAVNQLSLVPLGAGDLIDRAVRLYRRHFMTLIRIAAPPVIVTTLGSLMMTIGGLSRTYAARNVLLLLFGFFIWTCGVLLNVIVMGGAARNLITHLLWNEPFSARTTYRNVRARFGGLLGTSIIIAVWIFIALLVSLLLLTIGLQIVFIARNSFLEISEWLAAAIAVVGIILVIFFVLLGFLFLVKFIAYAPQVLMVEGRRVFNSIDRSFNLARGNLRRLMAMFLFHSFATWSALMILLVPLGVYGMMQGINISPFQSENWPAWYAIGYNVLNQVSTILLLPIWMLGLSLMYVDERVRQEGYDLELLSSRQLVMPNYYGPPNAYYPQAAGRQMRPTGAAPPQNYWPRYQ